MNNRLNLKSLGQPVRKKGNQLFFNCPFHEDDSGHLGVNVKKGIYHCFKCNNAGKLDDLTVSLSDFQKRVEDYLNSGKDEVKEKRIEVRLPKEWKELTPKSGLPYRYLRARDISDMEIMKYKMGYCGDGFYKDRVIIPVYNDSGELIYFVGRSYTKSEPKYMNAVVPKDSVIFKTFLGRVDKAIVCEGIFDALRVGKLFPAIAILGKVINGGQQLASIVRATKQAFIMLDSDAAPDGFRAASLLNQFIPTSLMMLKEKDPGSMSLDELRRILPK